MVTVPIVEVIVDHDAMEDGDVTMVVCGMKGDEVLTYPCTCTGPKCHFFVLVGGKEVCGQF